VWALKKTMQVDMSWQFISTATILSRQCLMKSRVIGSSTYKAGRFGSYPLTTTKHRFAATATPRIKNWEDDCVQMRAGLKAESQNEPGCAPLSETVTTAAAFLRRTSSESLPKIICWR
jgi:hypothetical protein